MILRGQNWAPNNKLKDIGTKLRAARGDGTPERREADLEALMQVEGAGHAARTAAAGG